MSELTWGGRKIMEIGNNLQQGIPERFMTGSNLGGEQLNQNNFDVIHSKNEAAVVITVASENSDRKVEREEKASEMISEPNKMGEFKDKKGVEETTDLQVGPDIRYALKSDNINFLKRISWGPLTVAEYREVKHRINEITSTRKTNNNILQGKIIDLDQRKEERAKGPVTINTGAKGLYTMLSINV
jgi:hypothetical protein